MSDLRDPLASNMLSVRRTYNNIAPLRSQRGSRLVKISIVTIHSQDRSKVLSKIVCTRFIENLQSPNSLEVTTRYRHHQGTMIGSRGVCNEYWFRRATGYAVGRPVAAASNIKY